jgi:hypothetical protein
MLRRLVRAAMTKGSVIPLPPWARRPAGAVATITFFVVTALLLLGLVRPWGTLAFSTWPSGYEAGRIARNLRIGLGYASPFVALAGDNFLSSDPHGDSNAGTASPTIQNPTPGDWPTAWITPPYVLMWYLPFLLFGPYSVASAATFQILQVGLMALALGLAWALVRRVHGPEAAALTLFCLALYPSTWYFAIEDTHGTALFVVILLASLLTLDRICGSGGESGVRPGTRIGHGLLVGLGLMTEPSSLLFYAWLELWVARRLWRTSRRAALSWLATTGVACLVVLGPWFARNLAVLHAPVLFKSNLPMELYYGNNSESRDNAFMAHVHRFPAWTEGERLRLLDLGEPAYARLCLGRAVDFMTAHPGTTMLLSLRRIIYYWSINPNLVQPWRPLLTFLFVLLLGLWLVTTAALGRRRLRWLDHASVGFFVLFPVAYYATQFMLYRYRYPVEVLLILAAASSVTRAFEDGIFRPDAFRAAGPILP